MERKQKFLIGACFAMIALLVVNVYYSTPIRSAEPEVEGAGLTHYEVWVETSCRVLVSYRNETGGLDVIRIRDRWAKDVQLHGTGFLSAQPSCSYGEPDNGEVTASVWIIGKQSERVTQSTRGGVATVVK